MPYCSKCGAELKENDKFYNVCGTLGFVGLSGYGGGFSQYVVAERRWIHPLGELGTDVGALVEPLAVEPHTWFELEVDERMLPVERAAARCRRVVDDALEARAPLLDVQELVDLLQVLDHRPDASLFEVMEDCERRIIVDMLEKCNWNQTEAAERFHVPLSTLNQKIKRLGIETRRRSGTRTNGSPQPEDTFTRSSGS